MFSFTKRSSKFGSKVKKAAPYALGVLILAGFIVQGMYIKILSNRIDFLDPLAIKITLVDAAKDLSVPLVTEPATGRQFIPGQKLVFPAPKDGLRVSYRNGGSDGALQFGDSANVRQATSQIQNEHTIEGVFRGVPLLQACSKQFTVSLNKSKAETEANSGDTLRQIAVKTLRDGRVATIYQNDKCGYSPDNLLEYLNEVQSF